MQPSDIKDKEQTIIRKASSLVIKEKRIEWVDSAYNNKRLLVVASELDTDDIAIYSIQAKDDFFLEAEVTVPYYRFNKALFTTMNDELLIVSSSEYRIMEWSIHKREIKHSIVISSPAPIVIKSIKINLFKSSQISTTLFVESTDNCLRVFSLENKACLFLLKQFTSWALSNNGRWYITTVYSEGKTFVNAHLVQNFEKQPISSLFAKTEGRITQIAISKSNVYVIAVNENSDILAYTLWNMELIAQLNSNKQIMHSPQAFISVREKDEVVIIAGDDLMVCSIVKNSIQVIQLERLNTMKVKGLSTSKIEQSLLLYNEDTIDYWV